VVDFLFGIIEFFRYLLRSRRYKQILVEVSAFQRGWVTLSANFKWKGTSPPTIVGVRKLGCFSTSQWRPRDSIFIRLNRVPACDRQTDGRNCHIYYSALHCKQCGRAVKWSYLRLGLSFYVHKGSIERFYRSPLFDRTFVQTLIAPCIAGRSGTKVLICANFVVNSILRRAQRFYLQFFARIAMVSLN